MPRVSVLMPAYNVEQYVGEAIESILNQTFTDFEFIIINDGSTDGTADIIRKYAKSDKRIKFINHEKNHGVAHTRNELLDTALGEYGAFHDSDDISLPDRLQIQVDFLDNHPNISVVSAFMQTTPDNKLLTSMQNFGILDFYISNPMPNAAAMFRMQDINKNHLRFDTKLKTAEDYDFWQKATRLLKIYVLPKVLYIYRILNTSLCHNNPDLADCNKIIRDEILDFLTHNPFYRAKIAPRYRIMLFGIIPLLKVKRERIYLFDFIPLLKMKNMWWRLFDLIPVCKIFV